MSLIYNNDKPIGKCESYSIDKIPGTTPFVMLTNYEPLRSGLNENQQVVLEYLKDKCNPYSFIAYKPFEAIIRLNMLDPKKNELRLKNTIDELTYVQQSQVLAAFAQWGLEQEEE